MTAYDDAADGYDARHADSAPSRRRTAVLDGIQIRAVAHARRVLELGCGTGRLLAKVRAPVAVGVDISARMLAHARARGLPVLRADAHSLPFPSASFDAVISGKGVFRYLEPERAFAECARVLAPGGVLALHTYGNRTWSARRRPVAVPGVWELGSVDELLRAATPFEPTGLRRFRPIRVFPYLLEIPAWLDRHAPVQLWSHLVAVFRLRA